MFVPDFMAVHPIVSQLVKYFTLKQIHKAVVLVWLNKISVFSPFSKPKNKIIILKICAQPLFITNYL